MPRPRDSRDLIVRLGRGESPEALSLLVDSEGYVNMRDILFPTVSKGKESVRLGPLVARSSGGRIIPTFEGLALDHVDFTGSAFENSRWVDCDFTHVKLDRIHGFGMNFTNSRIKHASFVRADLSRANWGWKNPPDPLIEDCLFERTDLRRTTYGKPWFRRCSFKNCNFKNTRFTARLEDCVFEGVVADMVFFGHFLNVIGAPSDEFYSRKIIWNPMKNVDFSRAELRNVDFCAGIDLQSCKFPEEGYVRIPRPDLAYPRLLERIRMSWASPEREKVANYLDEFVRLSFREEQPFNIIREADLLAIFGEKIGKRLLSEFKKVTDSGKQD